MSKIEKINEYLDRELGTNTKDESIRNLKVKFNLTEKTATTYYYDWKRKFMKSDNCEPKAPIIDEIQKGIENKSDEKKGTSIKTRRINPTTNNTNLGIQGVDKVKKELIVEDKQIKTSITTSGVKIEPKSKLKIKKAEIEGEFGEYVVSNEGVRVGDKLFKTPNDVEVYRVEELKKFYATLGEITEVMKMC